MSNVLPMREAIARARLAGAHVEQRRRHGELRITHPLCNQRTGLTVSASAKDAPPSLKTLIKRLEAQR